MGTAHESNKAKIARRVIEVLEFFDEENREATVMDFVRRYNRPQSSTSELLASMVDLGLLYKDPCTRSYALTPRSAMLGTHYQPDLVREGRLTLLVDRLVAQTGLGVAIFGTVGLNAQIFSWRNGIRPIHTSGTKGFCGGLQEHLTNSAAGQMLLSTVSQPRRDGLIRRLNAESDEAHKFNFRDMANAVQACQDEGYVTGAVGYGSNADVCAVLIPNLPENRSMAIGFIYEPTDQIDLPALIRCLQAAVQQAVEPNATPVATTSLAVVQTLSSAA